MTYVFILCYSMILIGGLCSFWRIYQGPNTLNRILAFDFLCACLIALVAVYSIQYPTAQFLELILIFSLLGFATVIAFMEAFFSRLRGKDNG